MYYDRYFDSDSDSHSYSSYDSYRPWYSSDFSDHTEYHGPRQKKFRKNPVNEEYKETDVKYNFRIKSICQWTIKDYDIESSRKKIGEKLESPILAFGLNDEFKWRFRLYPKGDDELNRDFISVHLVLVASKEQNIKTHFSFCIPTKKRHCINELYTTHIFNPGQDFGVKRFKKRNSYFDHAHSLTIACDITVELNKPPSTKKKVIDDLELLLDSGNNSDVKIEVENKIFKAHKYILAARSPVFAAMFKHDMKENNENIIKIREIPYKIMEEILRFTYTGTVKNLGTIAKGLLAAADKYAFEDLKIICANELSKNLNINNVVEILSVAELHGAVQLKEQALKYLVSNLNNIVNTSFKSIGELKAPLLAQVIKKMVSKK